MMVDKSYSRSSLSQYLEDAVCLLALITDRQPDLDQVPEEASKLDDDDDNAHSDGLLELEVLPDIEVDQEKLQRAAQLRDQVLDRLAETLARFKTENKRKNRDAKHVCSMIMIIDEERRTSRMVCAKNEGLDKVNESFLRNWTACMKAISAKGTASDDDKSDIFDLVFKHQRQRISTYHKWLEEAFETRRTALSLRKGEYRTLNHSALALCSAKEPRQWTDDKGNEYEFKITSPSECNDDKVSEAVLTGDTLSGVDETVQTLFEKVEKVCHGSTDSHETLLKEVIRTSFELWKEARTQSAMRAYLNCYFGDDGRARKNALNALLCLCRIHHCVSTFVAAAEALEISDSFDYVRVPPPSASHLSAPPYSKERSPISAATRLGLTVSGDIWSTYFVREASRFGKLVVEHRRKCHFHAEIQTVAYYIQHSTTHEKTTVHPYIGCSRRCCSLCYLFIMSYGGFRVRGSHETILHRWNLPIDLVYSQSQRSPQLHSAAVGLLLRLKQILQQLLKGTRPPSPRQLLAQSSAALSSALIEAEQESARLERSDREIEQLMMMPSIAGESSVLVVRDTQNPEKAMVMGGGLPQGKVMTMHDAEIFKHNSLRLNHGLEKLEDEMPRPCLFSSRRCRRCNRLSFHRCAVCRMAYCSRFCQAKDWKKHLFICRLKGRPNDVDYLWLACRQWTRSLHNEESRESFINALFADDSLCKAFGFNGCLDEHDVIKLFCVYSHILKTARPTVHQLRLENQTLGDYIQIWAQNGPTRGSLDPVDCSCRLWYLQQRQFGFDVPNLEKPFLYQELAWTFLDEHFSLTEKRKSGHPLLAAERAIISLYSILVRAFANIPEPRTSEWFDFGFCFCKSRSQRKALRKAYLGLLRSEVSIVRITVAWESCCLGKLFHDVGINVAALESDGVHFGPPHCDDMGVYRLIAETSHALSGCYCACLKSACAAHSKYETLLSKESEGNYGFHGASPWERWQLLNFYAYVFAKPTFDPRSMQAARRELDPDALERYLDSIVPGFRNNVWNRYLADMMFPKLRARVRFPNGRPPCNCVIHTVITPEGLDMRGFQRISLLTQETHEEAASTSRGNSQRPDTI